MPTADETDFQMSQRAFFATAAAAAADTNDCIGEVSRVHAGVVQLSQRGYNRRKC